MSNTDETEKREIFSHQVMAGSRTYFFDVKETRNGTRYVVISESRRKGSSFDHSRVMIFQEHIESFVEGFQKVLEFLGAKTRT